MSVAEAKLIDKIVLVYNADWSLRGGVSYLGELLTGSDSCALCDITHVTVIERGSWKDCKRRLGIPIQARYRNQLSAEQKQALDGEAPGVLVKTADGHLHRLLDRDDLEDCDSDPVQFYDKFVQRVRERGMELAGGAEV